MHLPDRACLPEDLGTRRPTLLAARMELLSSAPPPAPSKPDDFEERLHLAPMTAAEIDAALEETLPDGWLCIADAEDDPPGGLLLEYCHGRGDVAQAAQTGRERGPSCAHTRREARTHAECKGARGDELRRGRRQGYSWPPQRGASSANLTDVKGGALKVMKKNKVLERIGVPTEPPPRPKTTKERLLDWHKQGNPDFDATMFEFTQGKWTHLAPPERGIARENIKLRTFGAPSTAAAPATHRRRRNRAAGLVEEVEARAQQRRPPQRRPQHRRRAASMSRRAVSPRFCVASLRRIYRRRRRRHSSMVPAVAAAAAAAVKAHLFRSRNLLFTSSTASRHGRRSTSRSPY